MSLVSHQPSMRLRHTRMADSHLLHVWFWQGVQQRESDGQHMEYLCILWVSDRVQRRWHGVRRGCNDVQNMHSV